MDPLVIKDVTLRNEEDSVPWSTDIIPDVPSPPPALSCCSCASTIAEALAREAAPDMPAMSANDARSGGRGGSGSCFGIVALVDGLAASLSIPTAGPARGCKINAIVYLLENTYRYSPFAFPTTGNMLGELDLHIYACGMFTHVYVYPSVLKVPVHFRVDAANIVGSSRSWQRQMDSRHVVIGRYQLIQKASS